MQHIDPQGDKLNKNRYADEWDVGGLAVLAHYLYYSMIFRMGFIMEMTGLDKEEMEGIKCDGFVMVIFGGLGILL